MTCDELRPDYVLFAMGVLEDPERSELRAHLERGCQVCTPGVIEARQLLGDRAAKDWGSPGVGVLVGAAGDGLHGELLQLWESIVVGEALGQVHRAKLGAQDGRAPNHGLAHGQAFHTCNANIEV